MGLRSSWLYQTSPGILIQIFFYELCIFLNISTSSHNMQILNECSVLHMSDCTLVVKQRWQSLVQSKTCLKHQMMSLAAYGFPAVCDTKWYQTQCLKLYPIKTKLLKNYVTSKGTCEAFLRYYFMISNYYYFKISK